MRIVIELSEQDYRLAFTDPDFQVAAYVHAVKNGTPLPKGHGRLIDADALEPDTEWDEYTDGWSSYSRLEVENAPTIVEADREADREAYDANSN